MPNTVRIREVTLAQISTATFDINDSTKFGTLPVNGVRQTRSWAYEPMIVRVTDHVADTGSTEDDIDHMALFLSIRHGEPWKMTGHQSQHLIHPIPGSRNGNKPITSGNEYTIIYPDFDYSTFE